MGLTGNWNRLFRVEAGEWPKLFQFGFFGFLLQVGMGIGFSIGDGAFFSHVGAEALPIIFILTPLVMLVYTGIFSVLMLRFSLEQMVLLTLAILVGGGLIFAVLIDNAVGGTALFFALKLYLAVWYVALYTLFWNYTDAYFHIQDAKRLFPLFAAFCALGTACGAMIVNLFAGALPMAGFLLLWAIVAAMTVPWVRRLGRRWQMISEFDGQVDIGSGLGDQLRALGKGIGGSRFTIMLAATLFVTLLLTNLAEYQYASVFQEGRSAAELSALFGGLYAIANAVNLLVCLFLFNRLVSQFGVRNVAFILPITYFAVFGIFFLQGGMLAALAAFFAYHAVLTSIEYNNQNLLFNAVPSAIKRPLRTVVEGMCEPLASLFAGGFLLLAARHMDMRELSGVGLLLGAGLIAIVMLLRRLYPAAMAQNMRQLWLDFGANRTHFSKNLRADLQRAALDDQDPLKPQAASLLAAGDVGGAAVLDVGQIPRTLAAADQLSPRDRRRMRAEYVRVGEVAVPHLVAALRNPRQAYTARSLAAQALADLSPAQFAAQAARLVEMELVAAKTWAKRASELEAAEKRDSATDLLARAIRERIGASIDFVLELLALQGKLPNSDLLIISLHSSNAKVRANAMEVVETGAGHHHFAQLRALLQPALHDRDDAKPCDGIALAHDALVDGNLVEQLAAVEILAARLDLAEFAEQTARLAGSGMPPELRAMVQRHLQLVEAVKPSLTEILVALSAMPACGAASLDSLLRLAHFATFAPVAGAEISGHVGGHDFWIATENIRHVAGLKSDLALVMLRMKDGRAHAA